MIVARNRLGTKFFGSFTITHKGTSCNCSAFCNTLLRIAAHPIAPACREHGTCIFGSTVKRCGFVVKCNQCVPRSMRAWSIIMTRLTALFVLAITPNVACFNVLVRRAILSRQPAWLMCDAEAIARRAELKELLTKQLQQDERGWPGTISKESIAIANELSSLCSPSADVASRPDIWSGDYNVLSCE